MNIEKITAACRQQVNTFLTEHWGSTDMVIRGLIYDLQQAEGFLLYESGSIIGLLTYIIDGAVCEISSLDSLNEGIGIGTALIERVKEEAVKNGCIKLRLITTNDNTKALRFYQKRGFDLNRLYYNSLEVSRKLKPSIPLLGNDGIPLKHELELEMML